MSIFQRIKKVIRNSQHREVIFASAILSSLVLSFFTIDTVRSYQADMNTAKNTTQNLGQVLESRLAESFDEIDYRLKDICDYFSHFQIIPHDKKDWGEKFFAGYLHSALEIADRKIIDFLIFDQSANFIKSIAKSNLESLIPIDFLLGPAIDKNQHAIFSEPIRDPSNGEWIFFTKRSYFRGGNRNGSVISAFRVAYFQNYFDSLNIGSSGSISLLSETGHIMARMPAVADLVAKKRTFTSIEDGSREITVVKRSSIDGDEKIATIRKVGSYPFRVSVAMSHKDVFSAWLHRTLFNAVLVLSAFAGFATFLFRYLETQEDLEGQRRKNVAHAKMSSLGEMASGIAHEINNPLAILQAKIFQMRKLVDAEPLNKAKIYEHADKMDDTVQRIAKIIKGLRSFSRNSEGDPMSISSAGAVIESTLEFCQARFKASAIVFKLSPIPEAYIKCRESQLAQVVLNLLNNSFDAVSGLDEKWISMDVKEKLSTIEIVITDSGKGIPTSVVEKMMFPFFTTKGVDKGTGLGLSISKGIVEEHGGKIHYDASCPNTCFIVTLPKAASAKNLKIAS